MTERRDVLVRVFAQEQYDGDWPPRKASEFVVWFEEKLATIPPEFLDSATIAIDSVGSYEDSHYARLEIQYIRLETDEEMALRTKEQNRKISVERQRELTLLASLKAKYEGTK